VPLGTAIASGVQIRPAPERASTPPEDREANAPRFQRSLISPVHSPDALPLRSDGNRVPRGGDSLQGKETMRLFLRRPRRRQRHPAHYSSRSLHSADLHRRTAACRDQGRTHAAAAGEQIQHGAGAPLFLTTVSSPGVRRGIKQPRLPQGFCRRDFRHARYEADAMK